MLQAILSFSAWLLHFLKFMPQACKHINTAGPQFCPVGFFYHWIILPVGLINRVGFGQLSFQVMTSMSVTLKESILVRQDNLNPKRVH
jgi:hypothetical protein